MRDVGRLLVDALVAREDPAERARIRAEVHDICARFPVPGLPEA
jgi:glycine/serine hydroxymethyltransferase